MNIYINSVLDSIESQCTLHDLLIYKGIKSEFMALAVNNRFVPRALFKTTVLKEDDRINLIIPMQGG